MNNEDLLSDNFTRHVDIRKVEKNMAMIRVVLIIGTVNSIAEIARWLQSFLANTTGYLAPANFHYVLIFFVSTIPLAILSIVSWFFYLKANRLIKLSLQNNDPHVFNKAYTYFNRASLISILAFCLNLISIFIMIYFG